MTLARPGLLWLGAAFAIGVVLLHMLRRHPGRRRPLPTARFLVEDRRTRLRLRPPAHPALLAIRLGALGALTLAAAGPTLPVPRDGALRVVLLDAGVGMESAWTAALDSAGAALAGGPARLVAFDSAARELDASALDSLRGAGPSPAAADYRVAFRALREVARSSSADAFDAVLVTSPRTGPWRAGATVTRDAAWPASIRVVSPPPAPGPGDAAPPGDPTASGAAAAGGEFDGSGVPATSGGAPAVRVVGVDSARTPYLAAALASLGAAIQPTAGAGADARTGDAAPGGSGSTPVAAVLIAPGSGPDGAPAPASAGTVARWGPLDAAASGAFGWRPSARGGSAGGRAPGALAAALLVRPAPAAGGFAAGDPVVIDGPVLVAAGAPAPGARVWAVTSEGRPAGVATAANGGCRAYFAGDLLDAALVASPGFPAVVERMIGACEEGAPGRAGAPLGSGAATVLGGAERGPATAQLLGLDEGRPIGRLLFVAAFVLFLLEIGVGARAAGSSVPRAAAVAAERGA